jgi:GT2 family glycosyltransferase
VDKADQEMTAIPDLSVITVNWNTCGELRECLESVSRADPGNMEVIVVDNASGDDSVHMVRREFPNVRLIENTENLGFGRGSNKGIEASRGRYVLLLNPDSVVQDDSLSALLKFADANPDSGIIGLKIMNPDGTLQYSCRRFPTLQAAVFRNTILAHFFPKNTYTLEYLMADLDHTVERDVDWVSGAAMLVRREFIEDVGIFDERFFMYCEDVDLGFRAKQNGWRVTYFPGAVVVHARGRSSDKSPNRMIIEHHKSMYKFFKKHYLHQSFVLIRLIVPGMVLARASFFVMRNEYYRTRKALAGIRRNPPAE